MNYPGQQCRVITAIVFLYLTAHSRERWELRLLVFTQDVKNLYFRGKQSKSRASHISLILTALITCH